MISPASIYIRVNDLASGLIDDDLAALVAVAPDGIMLPKANSSADATHLSAKLRVHEAENGLVDGSTRIIAIMTETAAGVLAAPTWRDREPAVGGADLGGGGFVGGGRRTRDT